MLIKCSKFMIKLKILATPKRTKSCVFVMHSISPQLLGFGDIFFDKGKSAYHPVRKL